MACRGSGSSLMLAGVIVTLVGLAVALTHTFEISRYWITVGVGVDRGDFRLSPRLDYLVSGAVTLSIGADLFEGPRQTLYGQFDRNDRVTFTTTWRF